MTEKKEDKNESAHEDMDDSDKDITEDNTDGDGLNEIALKAIQSISDQTLVRKDSKNIYSLIKTSDPNDDKITKYKVSDRYGHQNHSFYIAGKEVNARNQDHEFSVENLSTLTININCSLKQAYIENIITKMRFYDVFIGNLLFYM